METYVPGEYKSKESQGNDVNIQKKENLRKAVFKMVTRGISKNNNCELACTIQPQNITSNILSKTKQSELQSENDKFSITIGNFKTSPSETHKTKKLG